MPTTPSDLVKSRTFRLTYRATIRDIPEGCEGPRSLGAAAADRPEPDDPSGLDRRPGPGHHRPGAPLRQPIPPCSGRSTEGTRPVTLAIEATRRENAGRRESLSAEDRRPDLAPEPLVPSDGPIRELAVEATEGIDDRRREGTGDLREGHRHDEVRQERDGLGPGRCPVRLRREAGQLHRLPCPDDRHGPLGGHPGPVRHRAAAAGVARVG